METKLPLSTRLAFIGCGVMAESMVAGLLRQEIVGAKQIVASHPRVDRRAELTERHGIECFEDNADAVRGLPDDSVVLLCVKPQRMGNVLKELAGVVRSTQLVVSIVAGARIEKIAESLSN
ncbi:MAG: NAD(P)-binding domain-containing protein, partial [Pyrinomonadaceae bacterium]